MSLEDTKPMDYLEKKVGVLEERIAQTVFIQSMLI